MLLNSQAHEMNAGLRASHGAPFWPTMLAVVLAATGLLFTKLGYWSWDKDEVDCLIELGVKETDLQLSYASQIPRLPKLIPVWYSAQRLALKLLPIDEFGSRCLPAACGVLTVAAAFIMGRRWRGDRFGLSLALMIGLNQCFVWMGQFNRFYSMALLFLTLSAGVAIWQTERRRTALALSIVLAVLGVLSHNLLVAAYGIAFIAATICWMLGWAPRDLVERTAVAAAAAFAVYAAYLRPIMSGWVSGGAGETQALVSFVAQLGVPTVALALLGIGIALRQKESNYEARWWCVALAGGVAFIGLSKILMGSWGPRYSLFFMLPFWALAALGVAEFAGRLQNSAQRAAWYGCVIALLLPKLASHFRDGSRHDFRAAAEVVSNQIHSDERVFCNFPLNLDYYLERSGDRKVEEWWGMQELPGQTCLVVWASNAFEPLLHLPGRTCEILERVGVRRYDEQSHILYIYRVWSAESSAGAGRRGT